MKSGKVIAIVVTAVIVAAVYFTQRTPDVNPESAAVTETDNNNAESNATNGDELDAKVAEAVEIIQGGTQPPMMAIAKLREVIEVDSMHVGANYWLGEFSVMSGQYEKAIPRYRKVLMKEPANVDVCIKLARAFAANGQKQEGVDALEAFMTANPDKKIKEQLMPVLNELIVES